MKSVLPKLNSLKIFIIDASGAFLSAILLYLIYLFDHYFGMPKSIVVIFISIALTLFLYSTAVYIFSPQKWKTYLKALAGVNICYCLFTIFHVLLYFEKLTIYGKLYFIGEVLVIIILSCYELKIATNSIK
jgi:hypothetical protein